MMDIRGPRIEALRSYIALLRREEVRLQEASRLRQASEPERAAAEDRWRTIVYKIDHADKELRDLEGARRGVRRP